MIANSVTPNIIRKADPVSEPFTNVSNPGVLCRRIADTRGINTTNGSRAKIQQRLTNAGMKNLWKVPLLFFTSIMTPTKMLKRIDVNIMKRFTNRIVNHRKISAN